MDQSKLSTERSPRSQPTSEIPKPHISGHLLRSFTEIQRVQETNAGRRKKRGLGGGFSGAAVGSSDPSLDEVATPWRDVGAVVAVEKPLQFFIVPLK